MLKLSIYFVKFMNLKEFSVVSMWYIFLLKTFNILLFVPYGK